jgi:hypothetical protein
MELDDLGGPYWLDTFQASGKERERSTSDQRIRLGPEDVEEDSWSPLEWRVGNHKATSYRLSDEEDCGKCQVPRLEFSRSGY